MSDACKLSAIICTIRDKDYIQRVLNSLRNQTMAPVRSEIIVVNNAPDNINLDDLANSWIDVEECVPELRIVDCAASGLSNARNAGLYAAKGDIVLYLDDDIVADRDLFEEIYSAYTRLPQAGVIGGTIELRVPSPAPFWYGKSMARFWSEYIADGEAPYYCKMPDKYPFGANWSARRSCLLEIGGFSSRYGRGSGYADSGEEMVAAIKIERLEYKIGISPRAYVLHHIDPGRFSLGELFRMGYHYFDTSEALIEDEYIAAYWGWGGCLVRGVAKTVIGVVPSTTSLPNRLALLAVAVGHFRMAWRLLFRRLN